MQQCKPLSNKLLQGCEISLIKHTLLSRRPGGRRRGGLKHTILQFIHQILGGLGKNYSRTYHPKSLTLQLYHAYTHLTLFLEDFPKDC